MLQIFLFMAIHFPTAAWATKATIYEVNLRQYSHEGSFLAFAKHLPRLKDMGIDILWMMPITPIAQKGRLGTLGSYYACSSYVKTNSEFGTIADFKQLVNEAHGLGMKVIIDWVANHTGLDHEWTVSHPEYYQQDVYGNFTERNGWKDVIDLNYQNASMRNALIVAMQFWITECKIDGFRCDMAHLVPLDFWKEARKQCDPLRSLYWLAECETNEYHTVFDTTYAWEWMHTTEKQTKGDCSLNDVYNVLHSYTQIGDDTSKLLFTSNHDENSWNGTEYDKYGLAAKAMAVFTCTWKAMPLIYSGQENANRKKLAFFEKDVLQWQQPVVLHDFYKALLALHKSPAIYLGETHILPSPHPQVMLYVRKSGDSVVLVALNLSAADKIRFVVQHEWLNGTFVSIFSQIHYSFVPGTSFEINSYGYLVYAKLD